MAIDKDADIVREKIRYLAQLGQYRLTAHAWKRSLQRNVLVQDIVSVLQNPTSVELDSPDRWRIEGLDLDAVALTLIAEILEDILIITVF